MTSPAARPRNRALTKTSVSTTTVSARACIRGMRIPVSVIVRQIAHGAEAAEILKGYPILEREDIQQAIEYAAWLSEEEVHVS